MACKHCGGGGGRTSDPINIGPPPGGGPGGGGLAGDGGGLRFHSCAIDDAELYDPDTFRELEREIDDKPVVLVVANRLGETFTRTQAILYPADAWEESIARANCEERDGLLFTPAPEETPATATGVGPASPASGGGAGFPTGDEPPPPLVASTSQPIRRFTEGEILLERAEHGHPAVIQGYGAVFYDGTPATEFRIMDWFIERIMPGAFDRIIAGDDDVVALFNHDPNNPLGRMSAGTLGVKIDKRGLLYRATPEDTTVARDLIKNLARGNVPGSSFSFLPLADGETWTHDKSRGVDVVEVHAVETFDVGPVMFPAYKATTADVENARNRQAAWLRKKVNSYKRRADMVRQGPPKRPDK